MKTLVAKVNLGVQSESGYAPVFRWLEDAGLHLINPKTNLITTFNSDGDRIQIALGALQQQIQTGDVGSVQMWLDDSQDVFISWQGQEMSLYLDGLVQKDRERIVCTLVQRFTELSTCSSRFGWTLCFEFQ
jgi:hypothetical protein